MLVRTSRPSCQTPPFTLFEGFPNWIIFECQNRFLSQLKVRKKILADGLEDESFDVTKKGKHLSAKEFNNLTDDPKTILIDFRNHYESEVGHFKGAITPDVDTFRDSLPIIEEEYLKGNEDKKENKASIIFCQIFLGDFDFWYTGNQDQDFFYKFSI